MIRTVEIKNFRGIQHARIDNAKRINVLTGPNGTGKTAFLEAIYLAAGNSPANLIKTMQWRGREGEFTGRPDGLAEAIWAHTFRDPDLGHAAVDLMGDNNERRSVEVRRIPPEEHLSTDSENEQIIADPGIEFIWHTPKGRRRIVPKITEGKIRTGVVESSLDTHLIPARVNVSERESANAFSRLKVGDGIELFERVFLQEFPMLKSVSVEAPWGPPAVWGRMQSGRFLPLSMISGGISHLAGILLRLAANPRCILLIDEIENGFFHDRYKSIWRTLYDMAVRVDGQIFATTHSRECLESLSEALDDRAEDIGFIRARLVDNEVSLRQVDGGAFFKSLPIGDPR